MNTLKTLGASGERLVANYLEREGFTIRTMNYTLRSGEIDIIAQKKEVLAFVEVKTRASHYFNTSEVITPAKQRKIITTAKHYIARNGLSEMVHRFDIALIEQHDIVYIPNAFTDRDSL